MFVPFSFINNVALHVLVVVAVMLGLHAHSVFLGHAKIGWGISCSALVYTAVLVVIAVYRLVSCSCDFSYPRSRSEFGL